MSIKRLTSYLGQVIETCRRLHRDTGYKSTPYFVCDYFLAYLRHGCTIRHYAQGGFYRLLNHERKQCITIKRYNRLFDALNDAAYIHVLENKAEFNEHFARWVKRDWLYMKTASREQFDAFMARHHDCIVKPIGLCEGEGIRKITAQEKANGGDRFWTENQGRDVIIEQLIVQHSGMVFGNTAVNTVRAMTVLDSNGVPHLFKAILRAGVGDSVVDNYAMGGAIYDIDVPTGRVSSKGIGKHDVTPLIYHPQTQICMLGYQIPLWDQVTAACCEAAKLLPQCRFIGWDVAITPDGVELIEGNHNPDYELIEFLGDHGYYNQLKSYI